MTMNQTIEADGADAAPVEPTRGGNYFRPPVDILEQTNELIVLADMPGVTADGVDVHFEDGVLTISGRIAPQSTVERKYLLNEYGVGDFYRSFQVSDQVDPAQITAEMTGGVLKLRLPKAAAARPRKIVVQAK
ncbi:MAG: Hsp20/alpha crystallin family protein [Planctomycetia bacterium]|nr:Hsp20/alpha crystallin family protein [Planctomycetia bacterium]